MTAIVITGTDTDVGKTWLGRALGHALAATGRRVVAIKPVETGCDDATALQEDGALLAAATGQTEPLAALYRFPEPVAPALAAEAAGESLDLDTMLLRLETLSTDAEVVLIEGAGGLLDPMTWEWTVVDLARGLAAATLIVAPDRLGTINHTLLTLGALELAGIEVAGVVLMTPASPDPSTGTNAGAIARLAGVERIVTLPRLADPAAAAKEMEPILGWISSASGPADRSPG
jgi:dethiobiotin synthetase